MAPCQSRTPIAPLHTSTPLLTRCLHILTPLTCVSHVPSVQGSWVQTSGHPWFLVTMCCLPRFEQAAIRTMGPCNNAVLPCFHASVLCCRAAMPSYCCAVVLLCRASPATSPLTCPTPAFTLPACHCRCESSRGRRAGHCCCLTTEGQRERVHTLTGHNFIYHER